MNKVIKTMVAITALTLTVNADNVTANETAIWNEIQRVFLTWNGKPADQYATKDAVVFYDNIGKCCAVWFDKGNVTQYELHYDFGDDATCAAYDDAYRLIVDTLNAYGKITGTKEDKTYLTYEWTLADGTTIKIGPTRTLHRKPTFGCTKKNHRNDLSCMTGASIMIRIPR